MNPQPQTDSYSEAQTRIPSQRQIILNKLIEVDNRGITNTQLQSICIRWSVRLQELYELGYVIDNVSEGEGVYRYTLISCPETPHTKQGKALDVFLGKLYDMYGEDMCSSVADVIADCNFNVTRKIGYYKN